jgi:adenylosuccinate lyase
MIRRRLREELPFMATENLLMRAVRAGGDRQELHERIRRHGLAAGRRIKEQGEPNDLLDRLAGDAAFGVTRKELEDELRPDRYVGLAPAQVDRFLEEWVEPVLERYPDAAGQDSPALRV